MSVSFKGAHFPKDVILHAVFFYLRYGVSYRDLEEIMAEWGVLTMPHSTGGWSGMRVRSWKMRASASDPLTDPGAWTRPISK